MIEQELKSKYDMFTELWRFYRKWAIIPKPMSEDCWKQATDEIHEFWERYGKTRMAECFMLAVMSDLEDQERKWGK